MTAQATLEEMTTETRAKSLLQRIILPRPGEPLDVRKLYLEESDTNAKRAHAPTRTSLSIGAESEVSFCTYFNAVPASYWRRWSILRSVVLRLELSGHGRVDVYRSKADGSRIHVQGSEFSTPGGAHDTLVEFEVDLGPFEDGGWIWFDITTDSAVEVRSGGWYAPIEAPGEGSIAVGMPTFNRPTDAVKTIAALGNDPLVLEKIKAVIIPDQGNRKVVDEPGFAEAALPLGDRLAIHNQPNLGGSGGYSRVMYEALKTTDAEYIVYMDDDIEIEPDSILRALAFSRFAKSPILTGGQMLNLQERSHLHVMGEIVDRSIFMWTAPANVDYDHDFSKNPLSDRDNSKLLHRRIDVDFNGWWTCVIPRQVAEEIGQPLPLFLKWDDVEYGLRARDHGYPTVTLPGAAVWHMAWSDKDDAIDWQAYFHLRNRLVVASLHLPNDGRPMVVNTIKATLKHLLCLEYSTVAIQNEAIRDYLAGGQAVRIAALRARQGARHAQGVPGRGGRTVLDRTADGQPRRGRRGRRTGQPARQGRAARQGRRAQLPQGQPRASRDAAVERPDPRCPLVPAVAGGRCHRHHRRRPRCGLPQARSASGRRALQGGHAPAQGTGRALPRSARAVSCGAFASHQ